MIKRAEIRALVLVYLGTGLLAGAISLAGWRIAGQTGQLVAAPLAILTAAGISALWIYRDLRALRAARRRAEAHAREEARKAWAAHIHATRRN